MRSIRYSKYTGDDLDLSAEDLMKALSDFFLESGFQNQYMGFSEWNQQTPANCSANAMLMVPAANRLSC